MKKLWNVVALLAVLAMATGCSLTGGTEPAKPAEDVIKEAMTNLSKVTSGNYELAMKGDVVGAEGQVPANASFDGTIGGLFDSKDPKKPQFTMKLDGTMSIDKAESQDVEVELRLNQTDVYVNLAKLPDLGESVPKEMVAAFTGKWWQIAIPAGAFEGLPVTGGDEATMTPEQKALKTLIENTKFFKDLKFEGNESVGGSDCLHYVGSLDKVAIKTFVTEAAKLQGQVMSETELKDLDSLLGATEAPADLWVDSSNMTMKKIGTKLTIAPEGAGSLTLDFSFMVSDVNKAVTVEVPAGATIFDPAMLFGGAMPTGATTEVPAL
ncbi:MAG: hypothetical protein WCX95_03810 [Candidatus Gracilibacteria bacterium]